uniref:hypothetical protein n=1 Tax=Streptomyces sp. NRRL F-5135 TaxID=1463858 RepID=UPI001F45F49A
MTQQSRRFHLQRNHDVTGVSGTGIVAHGVLWPDGTVSVRWAGDRPSTVAWDRIADAEHVHGHGGHTVIVWDDPEPVGWDNVTAEHGDEMRLDIHIGTPADDAEVERLRGQLNHAEAELTRLHDAESADAAAGSYAGRAEEAEAAIARVRRLCEMTIACSVRVHAVQQAHDILAILDGTGQPDPLK